MPSGNRPRLTDDLRRDVLAGKVGQNLQLILAGDKPLDGVLLDYDRDYVHLRNHAGSILVPAGSVLYYIIKDADSVPQVPNLP